MKRLPKALHPLRHRSFLLLSTGSLLTFFGAQIQTVGAAWEMMALTPSSTFVALVQSASALPALFFVLLGGAWADMFDRRQVLLVAQVVMLVSACLLLATHKSGLMTPSLLLGLTFLLNIGSALRMPVQTALANDLVERSEVPAAVAMTGILANLGRTVGPALGGVLVALAGAGAAYLANVACIGAAIGSSLYWRAPPHGDGKRHTHVGHAILEGLRFCASERTILRLQLRIFFGCFCGVGLWALLPLLAKENLRGGPLTLGILFAAQGIGALAGAAALPRWYDHLRVEKLLRSATLVLILVLLTAAMTRQLVWLVPALLAGGCAWIVFLSAPSSAIQMLVPAAIRGRVVSVSLMAIYAAMALGSWCWGAMADFTSLRTSLLLAGSGLAASLLLAWYLPVPATPRSPQSH